MRKGCSGQSVHGHFLTSGKFHAQQFRHFSLMAFRDVNCLVSYPRLVRNRCLTAMFKPPVSDAVQSQNRPPALSLDFSHDFFMIKTPGHGISCIRERNRTLSWEKGSGPTGGLKNRQAKHFRRFLVYFYGYGFVHLNSRLWVRFRLCVWVRFRLQ